MQRHERRPAEAQPRHFLQLPADTQEFAKRESGLHKQLSPRQVAMIGLGCTIGTGLFLGSAISVKLAGPAVILSFAAGAVIALTVMWALAEMAVEHPAAGSFGLYAEMYLHPWAGFAVRYTYWLCLVMIIGSEVVAAAIYCEFWFPHAPTWIWIAGFSIALVLINTLSIEDFGSIEYWFAMIKVVTIVAFLILGAMLLFGFGFPRIGLANFTAHGGFSPHGWRGVGLGVVMAIFSFLGLEIVGVTAGEAADPKTAVPRALRRTARLPGAFLSGRAGAGGGHRAVDRNRTGAESIRARVRTRGHSRRQPRDEFRGALGGAFERALQSLFYGASAFFAFAQRICSGAARQAEQERNAGGRSAGVEHRHGGRAGAFANLQADGVCLSDWRGVFRRTVHLADDAGDAHRVSLASGQRKSRDYARSRRSASGVRWLELLALLAVLASTWWIPDFHVALLSGPPWLVFLTVCYFIWRKLRARRNRPAWSSQRLKWMNCSNGAANSRSWAAPPI